jgi:hypothetical protein
MPANDIQVQVLNSASIALISTGQPQGALEYSTLAFSLSEGW